MEKSLRFTFHAIQEMADDDISVAEVEEVVSQGAVLRHYLHDRPFPSRLMYASVGEVPRPVHVVCADESEWITHVITAYRPDPTKWDDTFTVRIHRI